ncbi:MAG: prepilin peptidase [Nitrosomonadales bacterium]|nr:prepilin peptidase [Nitrosomonadales bacterium]
MALLLLAAARVDVRYHRIPNAVVFWGAGLGILLNVFMPEGFGFASQLPGGLGFLSAMGGVAIGLAALLPMYLLRVMGAGDVKLMAMVGAFLGPEDVLGAILATFLTGGVLSLGYAWKIGVLRRTLRNICYILYSGAVKVAVGRVPTLEDAPETAGKFPYSRESGSPVKSTGWIPAFAHKR